MNQDEVDDILFEAERAGVVVDDVLNEESTPDNIAVVLACDHGRCETFTDYNAAMDYIEEALA